MVNPKLKFHRFSHVNGGAGVIPTVPVLCTMCPKKIPRIIGDKTSQFTGYKPTAACAMEAAGQEATVGHLAEHWQLMLQFHYNWTAESSKKPGRHHVSSAHTVFFSSWLLLPSCQTAGTVVWAGKCQQSPAVGSEWVGFQIFGSTIPLKGERAANFTTASTVCVRACLHVPVCVHMCVCACACLLNQCCTVSFQI